MRKLLAVLAIAASASANEISYRSLQSGSTAGGVPLHARGIRGEGQIVAVLDTGLDYDSCFFAEANGAPPPINTGSPIGGLQSENVDLTRRKVIAYDFLYSCDQFPNAPGCEIPSSPAAYDNQGHGTHAAAAAVGDRGSATTHELYDSIAPAAKLIVQDGGFTGGDNCAQRPGFGCPVRITPILEQAYRQGARIHSNSWGDRQGAPANAQPPTANYSESARDVDAFVFTHLDMLLVFNTGNFLGPPNSTAPASTLSAPGSAKNTLQVGGTRIQGREDDLLASFTLIGPTRDGRIKPDVVGPAWVTAGDTDMNVTTNNCNVSLQPGTSWSAPTVAGAAALVRQYFIEGFYPSGVATDRDRFTPSAALLKATIIAAARPVPSIASATGDAPIAAPPSYQQGFGFPVLDDALFLTGDRRGLRVIDSANGLATGETSTLRLQVRGGSRLRATLVWTDPPGVARGANDPTPQLVNDLDLRITSPSGAVRFGNEPLHPGQPDRVNNVEVADVDVASDGMYTISVSASSLGVGTRQSYALVVTGEFVETAKPVRNRAARH